MGRKTPFQIVCLVMFVAFAAVSCYLTVGSIHLSMSAIPQWCLWIAIVGLFILTSYGTKMIMDSFNRNLIIDNRGKKLAGGLVIVLITWLLISFPTNSHSLFYNKNARDFAKSEELYLIQQLQQLTNEEIAHQKFMTGFENKKKETRSAKTALRAEIEHPERPGVGDRAERCLQRVEEALGIKVGTITRLTNIGRSQQEINSAIKFYDRQIEEQIEIQHKQMEEQWKSHKANLKKESKKMNVQITNLHNNIQNLDRATLSDQDVLLAQSRDLIRTARGTLEAKGIKDGYTGYKSERLINVTEVWSDYFKGNFKTADSGMIYWILLSLVIDLAAFVFFNVAFKEND